MNREDVIRWAREADFTVLLPDEATDGLGGIWADCDIDITDEMERFAALVAAAEREACAAMFDHVVQRGGTTIGDAIRARGEKA